MFSNTGNFGNYYSNYQLRISSYPITVGNVPSIAILHMKEFENSEVYSLPLCNEKQMHSTGSLVADSQSLRHVKRKEMFPRIFYIKFIISTALIN